jgi:hypothetical protein
MSKNTNLSFLTDYITADITNGRIGINNASPTVAFDVVGATKITGVLTLTSTISNGTYAYTLPSATGTLALTSSLSSYVPYTGASASVDLGTFDLTGRYLVSAGASALGGVVSMRQDAVYIPKGDGYSSIASSFVLFDFRGYTGASTYKNFALRFDGLTDNTQRIYTLPDATGTLALTSSLSGYLPLTGGTLTGALGGTSASFSGAVVATSITNKGIYYGKANASFPTTSLGYFALTTNNLDAERGGLTIQVSNSTSTFIDALTLNYTGAATFSSSVTTNGDLIVSKTSTYSQMQLIDNTASGSTWITLSGFPALGDYTIREAGVANHLVIKKTTGNVGIGTITPRTSASGTHATLDIKGGIYFGSTNSESCTINNDDSMIFNIDADNSNTTNFFRWATNTKLETGGSELMRLTEAGNLGIGTTTPDRDANTRSLAISGGLYAAASLELFGPSAYGGRNYIIFTGTPQSLIFYDLTSSATRMTISSTGGIGAAGSTTNIYNPSDKRLKQNISTLTYGLDAISALNPIKFNWIDGFEPTEDGKDMLGFVAQEVQKVIPEAIESFGDNSITIGDTVIDNPLRVNEKFIIPVLVKAIQELKAEIETLKNK